MDIIHNGTFIWFLRPLASSQGNMHTGTIIDFKNEMYTVKCEYTSFSLDMSKLKKESINSVGGIINPWGYEDDKEVRIFEVPREFIYLTEKEARVATEPPQCPSEKECIIANDFFGNNQIDERLEETVCPKFSFHDPIKGISLSIEVDQYFSPKVMEKMRKDIVDAIYKISEAIQDRTYTYL